MEMILYKNNEWVHSHVSEMQSREQALGAVVLLRHLKLRAQEVLSGQEGDAVPSPCQSICRMHATHGLCEGCLRTLDEIAQWSRISPEEKRAIWGRIQSRVPAGSGD